MEGMQDADERLSMDMGRHGMVDVHGGCAVWCGGVWGWVFAICV